MFGWLFASPLPVGSTAPDFELIDEQGQRVRLQDYRGRKHVVLVWYPRDTTDICTKQLCEFRDAWPEVESLGVAVFGINPQAAQSHSAFKQRFAFPFPLLVDVEQRVGRLYQTYGWIVRRTVYAIDKEGVIRFAQRGRPAPAQVLASLR